VLRSGIDSIVGSTDCSVSWVEVVVGDGAGVEVAGSVSVAVVVGGSVDVNVGGGNVTVGEGVSVIDSSVGRGDGSVLAHAPRNTTNTRVRETIMTLNTINFRIIKASLF